MGEKFGASVCTDKPPKKTLAMSTIARESRSAQDNQYAGWLGHAEKYD